MRLSRRRPGGISRRSEQSGGLIDGQDCVLTPRVSGEICGYSMQRFVATIRHRFGIWLLLFAMASPGGQFCTPRFLDEKEGQKTNSHEEDRTKVAVIQAVRRHRLDIHREQLPGISSQPLPRHRIDAPWLGQVCASEGWQGEHQARNGCGAALLL